VQRNPQYIKHVHCVCHHRKECTVLAKKNRVKWINESGEESNEFRDVRQFVLVMPDSLGVVPDDSDENMSDK